ncbi:hypothetical protein FisN_6Hu279 [Fistulifera solaris]|uniref:Phospholipid scramblase n=1 Tax=Fistulifera solaris TaxID=1519565 RepID=A0A1Z5K798_FISSO|nr:hypothetical protein FisN_6Hu279 [Fistulifera solaris]|eukprot:GAX22032.1 hypothetical protein FisN_6Hu279 [Fistulifera solaris]
MKSMFQRFAPIPTVQDYDYVHHLAGPLFSDQITPSSQPGQVHHLRMKEQLWTRWSNDMYGIRYADGTVFAADIKGQTFTFRDRMVLRDTKEEVIGVMVKVMSRTQQTIKIYGLRPFTAGQISSEQRYKSSALYLWAEVTELLTSFQYVMTMADGTEYVADPVGGFVGSQNMRLTRNGKVCAALRQINWAADFEGKTWDVTVDPGVDPCLICCFIVVIDEMNENRRK